MEKSINKVYNIIALVKTSAIILFIFIFLFNTDKNKNINIYKLVYQ